MVAIAEDGLLFDWPRTMHLQKCRAFTISRNFAFLFSQTCTYSQIREMYILQKFVLIYPRTYICMYLPKQYFTFCLKSITLVGHITKYHMVVQSRHPITYCTN